MRIIDVFNGDADGICALHQLRLAQPAESEIVTGLKREIELLARVDADAQSQITVLDVSLARNRAELDRVLQQGARVRWFDHHFAGDVPAHPCFEAHIDTAPDVCTSLIVDRHLGGRFSEWAIAAAFGDNLGRAAKSRASQAGLDAARTQRLRELGEAINYNSYGDDVADVLIHPRELYLRLRPYADPVEFAAVDPIVRELAARRAGDLASAAQIEPHVTSAGCAVYILPDAPWSRRVIGTFAHQLANADPDRMHAVLKSMPDGSYTVSLRAPLADPRGADVLCRRFGGSGRAGAAGIDALPEAQLGLFLSALHDAHREP
ncbi:MAG: acetyltransferase [Gemmatimonadota bacterium]